MIARFVSAAAVAACLVAVGVLVIQLVTLPDPSGRLALLTFWCLLPAVWGLWAMASPASWVPDGIPRWGAVLGALLATLALFVLDLPGLLGWTTLTTGWRLFGVAVIAAAYLVLWTLVRYVYVRVSSIADPHVARAE